MGVLAIVAVVWAVAAGISVTLQVGGSIKLNDVLLDPDEHKLHAFFVSEFGILVGAGWLSALALLQGGAPPKRPAKKWSLFGGVVVLPCFVTTPAAESLGVQMVLMLLMLGMVGAALVFDWRSGRKLGCKRALGLLLLLAGVCLQMIDAVPEVDGPIAIVVFYTVGCLIAGALFAVQAKMNKRLARDLGSAARSVALCNITGFLASVPIIVYFRLGLQVFFLFDIRKQWWIWLLCGLQSAFYTYSLSKLPLLLGYSVLFVLVLTGKLVSSALADTLGLFKAPISLSPWRVASITVMVAGAVLYTMQSDPAQASAEREQEVGSLVDTFSFCEVDNQAPNTAALDVDQEHQRQLVQRKSTE